MNVRFEIPVPAIYRVIDPTNEEFDCVIPMAYAAGGFMGDCLECDESGNTNPDSLCASPMNARYIGKFVALLEDPVCRY